MAPQGTGGFYVRRDMIPWIQPSWIGSHSQKDFDLAGGLTLLDEAKRFEFGTRNLADQIGFGKALDCWGEIGWENVFSYIAAYTDRLKAALREVPGLTLHTPLPYGKSSGIVTFSLGAYSSAEIQGALEGEKGPGRAAGVGRQHDSRVYTRVQQRRRSGAAGQWSAGHDVTWPSMPRSDLRLPNSGRCGRFMWSV